METRGDHEAQVHGAASDDELNDDSSDTDDSSETSVPAKYCFTAQHVARLKRKYPWYSHDATTGRSICLTCESASLASKGGSRCKLHQGILIDSKHISSRLSRHEKEPAHKEADGRRHVTVEAMSPAPENESIKEIFAAARRKRNTARDPITLAALYLGNKSRPATDMPEVCALIQKASKILGATLDMEQTHHDEHTCAKLLELMSDKTKYANDTHIFVFS